METLRRIGVAAAGASDALVHARRRFGDESFGESVSEALREVGAGAVPALRRALVHPDASERAWAATLLASFYELAQPAIPELRAAVTDLDEDVRVAAVMALQLSGAFTPQEIEAFRATANRISAGLPAR